MTVSSYSDWLISFSCKSLKDLFLILQIRRIVMSEEDEYGFNKPQQPTYYDEGLEKTRETLNKKIEQLNSAIDNVSSRLRGREKNTSSPNVPVETDPEVEATT